MGLKKISCRTFAVFDFIRVPLPAASMTAVMLFMARLSVKLVGRQKIAPLKGQYNA
jgi:hypothetical protein